MCPSQEPGAYSLSTNGSISPEMDISPMFITTHAGMSERPPRGPLSCYDSGIVSLQCLTQRYSCHLTTSIPTRIFPGTAFWLYFENFRQILKKMHESMHLMDGKFFGYRGRVFFIHLPQICLFRFSSGVNAFISLNTHGYFILAIYPGRLFRTLISYGEEYFGCFLVVVLFIWV